MRSLTIFGAQNGTGFLREIARASRAGDVAEALGSAEEALATDNEALAIAERSTVGERKTLYRVRKKKKR